MLLKGMSCYTCRKYSEVLLLQNTLTNTTWMSLQCKVEEKTAS
jgi:hypothetical protein